MEVTRPNVGDKAPDFSVLNEKSERLSLADYHGKKLILFFYPRDLSSSCTVQVKNLRDHEFELQKLGFTLIGISPDGPMKHQKFIDKNELSFSLLADEEHAMMDAYGVWGPKKFFGKDVIGVRRTTFLIDEKGVISHIIDKVKTKSHAEQIMELLGN